MKIIDKREKNIENLRKLNLQAFYERKNLDSQNLMNLGLNMYIKTNLNFKNELYNIFNESKFDKNKVLHPQQLEVLNLLLNGDNVLLSAPTSFGKTFIALEFITRKDFNNVIFVVPTLALMNELSKKIQEKFSNKYNVISNSFEILESKNIFIIVPERINNELLDKIKSISIDLLVFDEIYKLKRKEKLSLDKRTIALNKSYFDMVNRSKQVLLLGPFIKDLIFNRTCLTTNITKYFSDFAPVYIKTTYKTSNKNKFVLKELKNDNCKLIYFKTPNSIFNFCNANTIITSRSITNSLTKWCDKYISDKWIPSIMLKKGIGVHYGSIPSFMRQYIEFLYNSKTIKNMLCTSTLLEGINTPTNELIIYDSDKLSAFEVNNLIGRVGRLDTFKEGNIYYFDKKIEEYILGEGKYETIEIVAEDNEIQYIEELLYLEKENTKLSREQKKTLEILSNKLSNYDKNISDLKNTDGFVIKELIKFLDNIPELLKLLLTLLNDKNSEDTKLKCKTTYDRNEIIKLFVKIIPCKTYYVSTINNGLDNSNKISSSFCINTLLAKNITNIYTKINKLINSTYKRIGNEKINIFIDFLFYLSFTYIKYDLSRIVKYCNFIFDEKYTKTLDSKSIKLINLLKSEILARFEIFNSDNNKILKILIDIGIPYSDANVINKIIKNKTGEGYISTGKIYNFLKDNKDNIKSNKKIDQITIDLLDMII